MNWLSLPVLLLAALVQATFIPQIRILGGGPDLVFLFVLAWSLNARLETGVTWAFVGGIIQDLMSAAPTGVSSLGMLIVVFGVSAINRQVYRIGFTLIVTLVLIGTLVQQIVVITALRLTGAEVRLLDTFGYIVFPTIVYNLVLIWPVYWIVRRLQRRVVSQRVTL